VSSSTGGEDSHRSRDTRGTARESGRKLHGRRIASSASWQKRSSATDSQEQTEFSLVDIHTSKAPVRSNVADSADENERKSNAGAPPAERCMKRHFPAPRRSNIEDDESDDSILQCACYPQSVVCYTVMPRSMLLPAAKFGFQYRNRVIRIAREEVEDKHKTMLSGWLGR
jgi:hypothetical protein